jgi:hypothetical protein
VPANHLLSHESTTENSTANDAGSNRDSNVQSSPLSGTRHDVDNTPAKTAFCSNPGADRPASPAPVRTSRALNARGILTSACRVPPAVHMLPSGIVDSPMRNTLFTLDLLHRDLML